MTPALSLAIAQTRELLIQTSDEILARVHRDQMVAGFMACTDRVHKTRMKQMIELMDISDPKDVAADLRFSVERFIKAFSCNERMCAMWLRDVIVGIQKTCKGVM